MTPADAARLQDSYRRESASLLQYARSAAPHAAGTDRKLRDDLFRIGAEAAAALDGLGAYLDANRVALPPPGGFPAAFTDLNCVGVRHLLQKVAADRAAAAQVLDTTLSSLSDPAARAALQSLLDLARRHRDELAPAV
jgi:predicted phage gp36 major capsid-like protein